MEQAKRRVKAMEMELWRRCCGVTLRNEAIREQMGVVGTAAVSYTHLSLSLSLSVSLSRKQKKLRTKEAIQNSRKYYKR